MVFEKKLIWVYNSLHVYYLYVRLKQRRMLMRPNLTIEMKRHRVMLILTFFFLPFKTLELTSYLLFLGTTETEKNAEEVQPNTQDGTAPGYTYFNFNFIFFLPFKTLEISSCLSFLGTPETDVKEVQANTREVIRKCTSRISGKITGEIPRNISRKIKDFIKKC